MNPPSIIQRPPSRLTVGTAQFGMEYGVANRTGRPSFAVVCEMIQAAYQGGVDLLDTAASYGESEEWIGRALGELGLRDRMRIATKLAHVAPGTAPAEAARQIEATVTRSLRRLGVDRLAVCMIHREDNIVYVDELLALRDRGLIEVVGISMVNPEFAHKALQNPEIKAWQISTNLLDRRYTHSGLTAAAHQAGVTVFVRSVYLQGLLLMTDAATPPYLPEVIAPRQKFREMAARFGLPLHELAMRAILSRPDIQSVVVGSETVDQIRENLALVAKGPLPAEVLAAIEAFDPKAPYKIVSPREWFKAKDDYDALQAKK